MSLEIGPEEQTAERLTPSGIRYFVYESAETGQERACLRVAVFGGGSSDFCIFPRESPLSSSRGNLTSHDVEFDRAFRVESKKTGLTSRLISRFGFRHTVRCLFELGCSEINVKNGDALAVWRGTNMLGELARPDTDRIAELLRRMQSEESYCGVGEADEEDEVSQRMREVAFAGMTVVLVAAFVACAFAMGPYSPTDYVELFKKSLLVSVPIAVGCLWFLRGIAGSSDTGMRDFVILAIGYLMGLVFLSYSILAYLNVALDENSEDISRVEILEKWPIVLGTDYCQAIVRSWRPGYETERLTIPASECSRIDPGVSKLAVTHRFGWLGFGWVRTMRVE